MRRFLIVLSLIIFTTNSVFADCDPGYTLGQAIPTTTAVKIACFPDDDDDCDSSSIDDINTLGEGEWAARFSTNDVLYGKGFCSTTSGIRGTAQTTISSTSGVYCWCKTTKYNDTNIDSAYVYATYYYDAEICNSFCSAACANFYESSGGCPSCRTALADSVSGAVTTCVACPAKPDGAVWTTECEYQCGVGTYTNSVSTTSPVTFPTTAPDSTRNSEKTWSATWSNDTASGTSGCSSSKSSYGTSGRYCWCKLTAWNSTSLTASWKYLTAMISSSVCSSNCASYCADGMSDSTFRSKLFKSVTNTPRVTTTTCQTCPDGGTSSAGATAITQCYIPTTTNFTDAAGTYHFSSNCYYSN